jgi:hypothetical protein
MPSWATTKKAQNGPYTYNPQARRVRVGVKMGETQSERGNVDGLCVHR